MDCPLKKEFFCGFLNPVRVGEYRRGARAAGPVRGEEVPHPPLLEQGPRQLPQTIQKRKLYQGYKFLVILFFSQNIAFNIVKNYEKIKDLTHLIVKFLTLRGVIRDSKY